ncbi:DUF4893 domain-containing protein [Paracoccus sp. (in: a-proteobacteria)]|uniref:DUF4893 domain-containing protein n=1 Tax=Paracoccus sp. TaxID=267 RepID=UPI0026E0BD82|nr:DUF4893 domain-containing protein [Paracoccus sp. (in: a-proteobacteria)]MDO5646509.1 DUF4893 domain-containing protein [Paracoccus sp. (in: a-proteobacteria)]
MSLNKFAIIVALAAFPAWAQTDHSRALPDGTSLRADDLNRLTNLNGSLGGALRQSFASGDPAAVGLLTYALSGKAVPPAQAQGWLSGEWNCQMMKLGGGIGLTVYQPFRCHAGMNSFEKLTGSQRTVGKTYIWKDQLIYVGTGFIAGDTPPPYAHLPEAFDHRISPQRAPEVGVIEMISPNQGRIIFPAPYLESHTNVLFLTR